MFMDPSDGFRHKLILVSDKTQKNERAFFTNIIKKGALNTVINPKFAIVENSTELPELQSYFPEGNGVYLVVQNDEKTEPQLHYFNDRIFKEYGLKEFVTNFALPRIGSYSNRYFGILEHSKNIKVLVFYEKRDRASEELVQSIPRALDFLQEKMRETPVSCLLVEKSENYKGLEEKYHVSRYDPWPILIVSDDRKKGPGKKYAMDSSTGFGLEEIKSFFQAFFERKLSPHLAKEPVPVDDKLSPHFKIVVSSNYEEKVFKSPGESLVVVCGDIHLHHTCSHIVVALEFLQEKIKIQSLSFFYLNIEKNDVLYSSSIEHQRDSTFRLNFF